MDLNNFIFTPNEEIIETVRIGKETGKDLILPKLLGMLDKGNLTNDNLKAIGELYGMTPAKVSLYAKRSAANIKVEELLGRVPQNVLEFVELVMKRWKATMTFDEIFTVQTPFQYVHDYEIQSVSQHDLKELDEEFQESIRSRDPKTFPYSDLFTDLYLENEILKMGYKEQQLRYALDKWMSREKNEIVACIKNDIRFDKRSIKDSETYWDIFIESITDSNIPQTKVVLKHFIWQVKRKMFNLPVDYHMMPVLVGDQGIGKSTVIKKLVEPIYQFVANTDFAKISDDRNHNLWKNFVLVFDEMSHADSSDVNTVKRRITEDVFESRLMRTNTGTKVINKATFLGSSNRDLSRLIFDDTGMRRFYQVSCSRSFDHNIINNYIPYLKLWQSVNEKEQSPLVADQEMFKSISKLQEEKRRISLVEQFLIERKYTEFTESVQATTFFHEFLEFEREHTPKSDYNSTKFGREVMDVYKRVPGLCIEKKPTNKFMCYLLSMRVVD